MDGVCLRWPYRWVSAVQRVGHEEPGEGGRASRLRGSRTVLLFFVVGRTARPTLRDVRLLAHQPELFPRASRHPPADSIRQPCVVPVGPRTSRFQSARPAWYGVIVGLLGAHRIRVRSLLNFEHALSFNSDGHARAADYFCCDGLTVARAGTHEGEGSGNSRVAAPNGAPGDGALPLCRGLAGSLAVPGLILEDEFSRPREAVLFACDPLDCLRISF